jgi:ribosomal protein S18 acetylase RimI-like enzyme
MTITYRNANEGDVAAMLKMSQASIEELHQKFDKKRFKSMITKVMSDPEQKKGVFIAEDEGKKQAVGMIVGITKATRAGKTEGFLQNITVIPEFRGQGLGKVLAQKAVEHLKSLKVPVISVNVRDSQPQAITMYERLGFARSGNVMHLRS